MNHLNYEFDASKDDTAEVTLDRAANVLLMDSANYQDYIHGRTYRYFGGYATKSPVRMAVPRAGHWHVVVDLGGGAGQVARGNSFAQQGVGMKGEYRQVVRLAQPGELKAYVVFEHQLDMLANGSPTSLLLNFALFFLGVAAMALGTLVTVAPNQDRTYYSFLIIFLVTLIAGAVLLAVWYAMHKSVTSLVFEIRAQMPPNPRVEQDPLEPPDTGEEKVHASP